MKNIHFYFFFMMNLIGQSSFASNYDINHEDFNAGTGLMQLRGIYDIRESSYESAVQKNTLPVLIISSREMMNAKSELIVPNENLQTLKRTAPRTKQLTAKRKKCVSKNQKPSIHLDQNNPNVITIYESALGDLNDLQGKIIACRKNLLEYPKVEKLWDDNTYLNSIIRICFIEQNYPGLFENRQRKILVSESHLQNKSEYAYFNPYIVRKYWWKFLSEEIKGMYRIAEEKRKNNLKCLINTTCYLPDPEDVNDPDYDQYALSASDYGRAVKMRIHHVVNSFLNKLKKQK